MCCFEFTFLCLRINWVTQSVCGICFCGLWEKCRVRSEAPRNCTLELEEGNALALIFTVFKMISHNM